LNSAGRPIAQQKHCDGASGKTARGSEGAETLDDLTRPREQTCEGIIQNPTSAVGEGVEANTVTRVTHG
jgi:hypothetical protein